MVRKKKWQRADRVNNTLSLDDVIKELSFYDVVIDNEDSPEFSSKEFNI